MGKPNILFILIDDLGWRDLSCYGSSFYETPNLDRLATQGMTFTDAYAACPVCSPTRASILTGKYPARLGLTNYIGGHNNGKLLSVPYLHYLPLEEKTIAATLQEAGYRTYHVGKWHLGAEPYWPEHHGFEVNVAGCEWGSPAHGYFSPYQNPRLTDGPEGEYLTDRLTDEAIHLLETAGDDPFFMYLSYYSVHIPIQVPEENVEKYKTKAKELGLDQVDPFEWGEYFSCEEKAHMRVKRRLLQSDPAYAGMIERLDWNIGRVLQTIDVLGKTQDTIVLFFSDNGGLATAEGSPTCNAPLAEGKGWMYEGGTREPLIIRWPGYVEPGSQCHVPVTSTDFYPTFLEIAGLPLLPDQHSDGVSILSLLEDRPGGGAREREAIFWHYPHYANQGGTPCSSIRAGDYKLIEFFENGDLELYHLRDDVSEKINLARELPEVTTRLHRLLQKWREHVEARLPRVNRYARHARYAGTLMRDETGTLCLRTQLFPENPALYDIPLAELLEEFLEQPVDLVLLSRNFEEIVSRHGILTPVAGGKLELLRDQDTESASPHEPIPYDRVSLETLFAGFLAVPVTIDVGIFRDPGSASK